MSGELGDDSNSSKSFDRFLAGEDRLAALLRALPVFEAPADMTLRFTERVRAAQALHASLATPLVFEPPASLEAGFLAEAARIQAAQQPRHDAVIDQIHAGTPAAEVLGHDVAEATSAWLASRPERVAAQVAARAQTPPPRSTSSKWWARFGVLAASAFFGSVATNLWLAQRGEAPMATTMTEASPKQNGDKITEPGLPPPVELKVEPIAQISALSKPTSPPPSESKQVVTQRLQDYAEAKRAMKAEAAAVPADASENAMAERTGRADQSVRDRVQEQESAFELRQDRQRETLAGVSSKTAPGEERPSAQAPSTAGAAAPERRPSRAPAAATPAAPLPAPVAAPAPPPAMARTAAEPSAALRASLSNSAQDLANRWQAAGRGRAPRIFAARPDTEAVRDWVERFRQALSADIRPAQFKIEQDSRLGDDALRFE